MKASHWYFVLRLCCLVALGTSVALLVDYTAPEPAFCGGDSGCSQVRGSSWAFLPLPWGGSLPMPWLGVLAFASLFVLSLVRNAQIRARVLAPALYLTAAGAVALIVLQASLGSFCSLCMTVDSLSVIMAAVAVILGRMGWEKGVQQEQQAPQKQDFFHLTSSAWLGLAGLSLIAPLLFPSLVRTSEVPAVITELYDDSRVTVVEFFDFECPHCRALSPRLKKVVADYPEAELRFAYTPTPQHKKARDAARISICAAEQGREKEVAALFFEQEDLSREALLQSAEQLVKAEVLRACLASERPDARIADDIRRIKEAGFVGLPTTYVGGLRILGAESDAAYRDAIEQVIRGSDKKGMQPWSYWLAVLLFALVVGITGRMPAAAASKK